MPGNEAETVRTAQVRLDRGRVTQVLSAAAVALLVVGLPFGIALEGEVPFVVDTVGRLFVLDDEANVPTWFATGLLLACGLGFVLAAAARPDIRWRLRVLALVLVGLSIDEAAELHNRAGGALLLLRTGDPDGSYLWWVVAVSPLVVLVGIFVWPLLRVLPPQVRRMWWLAAFLYVGGAAGMEVVGSLVEFRSIAFHLILVVEEGMEFAGAIVLLSSLLLLASGGRVLELSWPAPAEAPARGSPPEGRPQPSSPSPRAQDVV